MARFTNKQLFNYGLLVVIVAFIVWNEFLRT